MYSVRVMISLFTRAMLSPTTASAGERDGSISAYPTANSRGSLVFFIRALSNLGNTRGKLSSYFTPRAAWRPIDCVAWLSCSCERQCGHVVVPRGHVHEVLHALQDALGKIPGGRRPRLHGTLHALQTKFYVLRLGLHHSARDHRQRGLWSQTDDAGICRAQREQPERQAGCRQLDDASSIAHQPRSVPPRPSPNRPNFFASAP